MQKYDVAAYIWPAYHYEPRMEKYWPEKDGEWYTVRRGTARFPGHEMPRTPLLGYQNEADSEVMLQQVKLGEKYGVNTFIMDWYWYDNQPCFERQLNEGLIPALEQSNSKFYLMWANHDATTLWNMHIDENELIWDAKVDRDTFELMMKRVIDKYFKLDSYYCIHEKPVFSIYSPADFVAGLGGINEAKSVLNWLRQYVVEQGLKGIHLQFITRRENNNCPESMSELENISFHELAHELDIDSASCYSFASDAGFVEGDYADWAQAAIEQWENHDKNYSVFFPHVSVGWDNTQRHPSHKSAVVNATPFAFEKCLRKAKEYIDCHPQQVPLLTINSWNEWTEGSYLLPDTKWHYAYLEAVQKIFL
jgi:Glycosyltransferase WbsX